MNGPDGTVSITAAARRLGVSRSAIWRMIAAGDLDAETIRRGGREVTRVRLPEALPGCPIPRSRTAQLQEQVDRLTQTVQHLSILLAEAERDRSARRIEQRQRIATTPRLPRPTTPEPADEPFPPGITARPNPMTHPATELRSCRSASRDDLLEPVRELFRREPRHRAGWLKLPLVSRS